MKSSRKLKISECLLKRVEKQRSLILVSKQIFKILGLIGAIRILLPNNWSLAFQPNPNPVEQSHLLKSNWRNLLNRNIG
jgi:hypothetical protein